MDRFPKLKTGAVAQYPAGRALRRPTEVHRFLDESEQRFRERSTALRRWRVRLSLLDEGELAELREFFGKQKGRSGVFEFEDPWSAAVVPGCRFGSDEMPFAMFDEHGGATEVEIVETP